MSKKIASKAPVSLATNAAFLDKVYDAAHNQAMGARAVIALLLSGHLAWEAPETDNVKHAYQCGFIAAYLTARTVKCDKARAAVILTLLPPAKDPSTDKVGADKRRTMREQDAVRGAITSWSYVAQAAGMPNARTGAKRAVKNAPKPDAAKDAAPKLPTNVRESAPRVRDLAGVVAFRDVVTKEIHNFMLKNADVKMEAFRLAFEQACKILEAAKPE